MLERLLYKLLIVALTIFLSGCSDSGPKQTDVLPGREREAQKKPEMPFPLVPGNYWVYKGQTKWMAANSNQVKEAVLTWKMQVVETFASQEGTVAVIKGHPSDLAWYEEGKAPSNSLIVQARGGRFHLVEGDGCQELLALVKAGKPIPAGTLSEETVFLQLPLRQGAGFGNTTERPIEPGFYSWAVEKESSADLSHVRGAPSGGGYRRYRLVFRTNPDHQIVDFVPGVGIVRYRYVHHGTTSETDLHLIECHLARAPGKEPPK